MGNPFGNLGGLGNLGGMMKQVKKMYEQMEKVQEQLADERLEATSGGGMVKAVANGQGELLQVKIDPQVVDPDDVEMLEDLVTSAVKEVIANANKLKTERIQEVTGGMGIPGLM